MAPDNIIRLSGARAQHYEFLRPLLAIRCHRLFKLVGLYIQPKKPAIEGGQEALGLPILQLGINKDLRRYSLGKLAGKVTRSRLLDSDLPSGIKLTIFPVAADVPGFYIERNLGGIKSRNMLYIAANHLLPTIENTMLTTVIFKAGRIKLDEKQKASNL